jgi:ABC-type nitrate/sulfonate/bicarbonate transport system ATPase subunit
MSARPGRIVGEEVVNLPRPREAVALRSDPHFGELFGRIWAQLRDQAL